MSSIFIRARSPYFWAKIRDPKTSKWKNVSTEFRIDDPVGKRKALVWANERDRVGKASIKSGRQEAWGVWVSSWLESAFAYNPKTLQRYRGAWAVLNEFLAEKRIEVPRQLVYRHSQEYMAWRTQQRRHAGKLISHNTAILDLKILSRIMREAHRREYCESNPLYQLGILRKGTKERAAMTPAEIETIRKALFNLEGSLPIDKQWMTVSFEIAMAQGCRLRETSVRLEDIDLNSNQITFHAKGRNGSQKIFTTALSQDLVPLIRKLQLAKATVTCTLPEMASKEWWKFRRDNDLSHLTFHATRVTLITEMARIGITQQKAMRFVGHASATVHRVYQRLSAGDVADVAASLSASKRARL